jgi:hypothetical protein
MSILVPIKDKTDVNFLSFLPFFFFVVVVMVPGIKPRIFHMPGNNSTTKLRLQPFVFLILKQGLNELLTPSLELSMYVVQAGLKLVILLSQHPGCWGSRGDGV